MAARLFSTCISHYDPLPHILSICLSTVNSSPCPWIAPQSLNSSSQPLPLPGDQHPCPGYLWLQQDCLILIPFRLPQISCFTPSLKCFSSDLDNCPDVGIGPHAAVLPPTEGRSSPTNTSVFSLVASSYQVLRRSIYSFPLVRYSCLLSAGVLHALLCLMVYS